MNSQQNILLTLKEGLTTTKLSFKCLMVAVALSLSACGGGSDDTSSRDDVVADDGTGGGIDGGDNGGNDGGTGGGDTGGGEDGTDEGSAPSPDDIGPFEKFFYPIVAEAGCAACHSSKTAATSQQTPFFADSDIVQAENYLIASGSVIFNNALESGIVKKMYSQTKHYCGDNCQTIGDNMVAAIISWGGEAQVDNAYNPLKLASGSFTYANASAGGSARDNTNAIALYEFKSCAGGEALDTSGSPSPINLTVMGQAQCIPGVGLTFDGQAGSKAQASAEDSARIHAAIAAADGSGEFTIEAWITYANDNSDGRIFVYDESNNNVNYQLRQNNTDGIRQQFNVRTASNGNNGNGQIFENIPEPAAAVGQLDHVVVTFDQQNGRAMYINGALVVNNDDIEDKLLANWDVGYQITMGSASNDQQPWPGTVHLAAIYDRAISPAQVAANFNAGLAPKLVVSFDISDLTQVAGTAIDMNVRELDEFSYVLSNPVLRTPEGVSLNIPVAGMYVAVNDFISVTSQTFSRLDTVLDTDGQLLLAGGAVISKKDPSDSFTLAFRQFANETNEPDPIVFTRTLPEPTGTPTMKHGYKNFRQIPENMAFLTGVPLDNGAFQETLESVEASLLESNEASAFKASQQTGIQKLALTVCQQVHGNNQRRQAFFSRVEDAGFSPQNLLDDLREKLLNLAPGETLATIPAEFDATILTLIDDMQQADLSEENIMIGSCAIVLGSSLVSVH